MCCQRGINIPYRTRSEAPDPDRLTAEALTRPRLLPETSASPGSQPETGAKTPACDTYLAIAFPPNHLQATVPRAYLAGAYGFVAVVSGVYSNSALQSVLGAGVGQVVWDNKAVGRASLQVQLSQSSVTYN
jgi:hypothetical protein